MRIRTIILLSLSLGIMANAFYCSDPTASIIDGVERAKTDRTSYLEQL